jgi:hypothetical protein
MFLSSLPLFFSIFNFGTPGNLKRVVLVVVVVVVVVLMVVLVVMVVATVIKVVVHGATTEALTIMCGRYFVLSICSVPHGLSQFQQFQLVHIKHPLVALQMHGSHIRDECFSRQKLQFGVLGQEA